jgi:hypothetical protein
MALIMTRAQFEFLGLHVGSSSHNEMNPNTKYFIHLVITYHDGDGRYGGMSQTYFTV